MQLRQYQKEAVREINKALLTNNSVGAILPTGSGKTEIFLQIIFEYLEVNNKHVLIISHRDTLTSQTLERIKLRINVKAGILQGNVYPKPKDRIIVTTMQSACKPEKINNWKHFIDKMQEGNPYQKYLKPDVGLIVVDEAHYLGNASYNKIFKIFPNAKMLGVTATPFRDGKLMTNMFASIPYTISQQELINDKWLVPPRLIGIKTDSKDIEEKIARIIHIYLEREKDNNVIVFVDTIENAKNCRNAFMSFGILAESIVNSTSKDTRERVFKQFREGKIKVLTTVNVLTEGFDATNIQAIFMPFETKSPTLYYQRIGRGLRPLTHHGVQETDSKQECRIYYLGKQPEISSKQWENLQRIALNIGKKEKPKSIEDIMNRIEYSKGKSSPDYIWCEKILLIKKRIKELKLNNLSSVLEYKDLPDKYKDIGNLKNLLSMISINPRYLEGNISLKQKKILIEEGFAKERIDLLNKNEASRLVDAVYKKNNIIINDRYQVKEGIYKGRYFWDVNPYYLKEIARNYPQLKTSQLYKEYLKEIKKKERTESYELLE